MGHANTKQQRARRNSTSSTPMLAASSKPKKSTPFRSAKQLALKRTKSLFGIASSSSSSSSTSPPPMRVLKDSTRNNASPVPVDVAAAAAAAASSSSSSSSSAMFVSPSCDSIASTVVASSSSMSASSSTTSLCGAAPNVGADSKVPVRPPVVAQTAKKQPLPPGMQPKISPVSLRRSNSTSTLFIEHTLENPDNTLMNLCFSRMILHRLESEARNKKPVVLPAFEANPSQMARLNQHRHVAFPMFKDVHRFVTCFHKDAQLSPECVVAATVYLERLVKATSITLTASNWRHLVFSTLVMASKMYDDLSMINRDFSVVCPLFTNADTNAMELALLDILHYDLVVSGAEYAHAYFQLLQLADRETPEQLLQAAKVGPLKRSRALKMELAPYQQHHATPSASTSSSSLGSDSESDENTAASACDIPTGPILRAPLLRRKVTCNEEELLDHQIAVIN